MSGSDVVNRRQSRMDTASFVKKKLGLPLTPAEERSLRGADQVMADLKELIGQNQDSMDASSQSSDDVVVAQFEKNKKEEVRLSVGTFHGRRIMNVRVYYKDDDGSWKPGKQGLAVSVERYKDLAGAILQVGEHLKANKLI